MLLSIVYGTSGHGLLALSVPRLEHVWLQIINHFDLMVFVVCYPASFQAEKRTKRKPWGYFTVWGGQHQIAGFNRKVEADCEELSAQWSIMSGWGPQATESEPNRRDFRISGFDAAEQAPNISKSCAHWYSLLSVCDFGTNGVGWLETLNQSL